MRCALILLVTGCLSAWLLCAVSYSFHSERRVPLQPPLPASSNTYISFLDTRFESYFSPETFSESFTIRSVEHRARLASSQLTASAKPDIVASQSEISGTLQPSVPMPRSSPRRVAQYTAIGGSTQSDDALTSDDKTTFLQKLFAKLFAKSSPSPVKVAYAAADDGQVGDVGDLATGRYDQLTAIYDISAHTVSMPDGTKLEAHSGFGASLDNPADVDQKDRGPTPPNVYNLELRGQSFHGVSALRLIPVDDQKSLGRTGLLAHSFMLGPNGDSNGCVSIREYDAFLHAYINHQIKRLIVVARSDTPNFF
jgi:hypothetical protein